MPCSHWKQNKEGRLRYLCSLRGMALRALASVLTLEPTPWFVGDPINQVGIGNKAICRLLHLRAGLFTAAEFFRGVPSSDHQRLRDYESRALKTGKRLTIPHVRMRYNGFVAGSRDVVFDLVLHPVTMPGTRGIFFLNEVLPL